MNISETLKKLYIARGPALLRFVSRYVPDTVAEDIVQDAFVRYYERYSSLQLGSDATKVLFSIAHNLCIDHLRHATASRDYKASMYARIALEELAHGPDDDAAELTNEKLAQVKTLVEQLTPRQQEMLHLYYAENMKMAEIADKLNLSRRTVENTIYRALIAIRKKL